jgi:hypothetical protein
MPDGTERIHVRLDLSADGPNSMDFRDTYAGLDDIWYRFSTDEHGNVELWANADGFEHLARYFLKMARGGKLIGYHAHHTLEFGGDNGPGTREVTIGLANPPTDEPAATGEREP